MVAFAISSIEPGSAVSGRREPARRPGRCQKREQEDPLARTDHPRGSLSAESSRAGLRVSPMAAAGFVLSVCDGISRLAGAGRHSDSAALTFSRRRPASRCKGHGPCGRWRLRPVRPGLDQHGPGRVAHLRHPALDPGLCGGRGRRLARCARRLGRRPCGASLVRDRPDVLASRQISSTTTTRSPAPPDLHARRTPCSCCWVRASCSASSPFCASIAGCNAHLPARCVRACPGAADAHTGPLLAAARVDEPRWTSPCLIVFPICLLTPVCLLGAVIVPTMRLRPGHAPRDRVAASR